MFEKLVSLILLEIAKCGKFEFVTISEVLSKQNNTRGMSDVEDLFQRVGRKLKWFEKSSDSLNISIDEKWKKTRDPIVLTSDSDSEGLTTYNHITLISTDEDESIASYHSNKHPVVKVTEDEDDTSYLSSKLPVSKVTEDAVDTSCHSSKLHVAKLTEDEDDTTYLSTGNIPTVAEAYDFEEGSSCHSNKSNFVQASDNEGEEIYDSIESQVDKLTNNESNHSESDKENVRHTKRTSLNTSISKTTEVFGNIINFPIHSMSRLQPSNLHNIISDLSKDASLIIISSDEADDECSLNSDSDDDDVFELPLKERLLRTCPVQRQKSRLFSVNSLDSSIPSPNPSCKNLDNNNKHHGTQCHTEKKKNMRQHHYSRPSFLLSSEDDDDDFEEFLAKLKTPKRNTQFKGPRNNHVTTSTKKLTTEKTAKPKHTTEEKQSKPSTFRQVQNVTAQSTDGKFLKSLSTHSQNRHEIPSIYVKDFKKNREDLTQKLFRLYNKTVFDGKLPSDMKITWNAKMRKTAGFCYYGRKSVTMERTVRIELADKVCDSAERVRDTLIHELCHAAAWYIHGVRDGHGRYWKYWTKKANYTHRELPMISRCHTYEINTKYNYQCMKCGTRIGRHSKSLDVKKFCCGVCGGLFQLLPTLRKDGTPAKTRGPNKFALYVKENYSTIKSKRKSMKHADVIKLLSAEFSKTSITN